MNLCPANDSPLATPRFTACSRSAYMPLVMRAGHREAADNDNPPPFRVSLSADCLAALQGMVTALLQQLEPGTAPTSWAVTYGARGSTCTAVVTKRRAGGAR